MTGGEERNSKSYKIAIPIEFLRAELEKIFLVGAS